MKKIEWLLLFALASGGITYFVANLSRFEPLAAYGPIPSATFFETAAEKAASSYGVDVSTWDRVSSTSRNAELRLAWEKGLAERAWLLRTPYSVRVRFYGPNRELCQVTIDYNGNPVGFSRESRDEDTGKPRAAREHSPDEIQRARQIAVDAFGTRLRSPSISGEAVDLGFQLTADAVAKGDDLTFEWTSNADPAGMVSWQVELTVRDGTVTRFDLNPLILQPLRDKAREVDSVIQPGLVVIISIGLSAVIVAFILSILNLFRKRLPLSFLLRTAVLVSAVLLADLLFGGDFRNRPPDWFLSLNSILPVLGRFLFNGSLVVALICAGRSTRTGSDFRRWLGVEDFLVLAWGKASVARAVWTAGLLAIVWIALPYAIAGRFPDLLFDSSTRRALGLPIPFIDSIASIPTVTALFAFAFALPLLKAYVKWRPVRGLAALLVGAIASATISPVDQPLDAALFVVIGYGVLIAYSYSRFGVLASVLGAVLSFPLARALAFTALGDDEMQSWGFAFLVATALFTSVALVLDLRNPAREAEQSLSPEELAAFQQESSRDVVSRREQLLGEFALAQQAQQRMLPDHPPYVEGFEIAAICRPAQQVGGDLYDYIHLNDGRWACCVADVSGKGVSAALYMTMVKGLLNALSLERADLMDIAGVLNQHIYEVMKRRSFVTMSLAAIDPARKTVEVLRAGHLPMLLIRADGEQQFVSSKGMGLGLAPSQIFRRNLNSATVTLQSGDVAVLYSDGVTEAMDPSREEFGEERFAAVVADVKHLAAIEIRDRVMEAIQRFQRGAPVHDDITVVVLRLMNGAGAGQ